MVLCRRWEAGTRAAPATPAFVGCISGLGSAPPGTSCDDTNKPFGPAPASDEGYSSLRDGLRIPVFVRKSQAVAPTRCGCRTIWESLREVQFLAHAKALNSWAKAWGYPMPTVKSRAWTASWTIVVATWLGVTSGLQT